MEVMLLLCSLVVLLARLRARAATLADRTRAGRDRSGYKWGCCPLEKREQLQSLLWPPLCLFCYFIDSVKSGVEMTIRQGRMLLDGFYGLHMYQGGGHRLFS